MTFNYFILIAVPILFAIIGFAQFMGYRNRMKEMERTVDAMLGDRNREMRLRFMEGRDEREYAFLVLSEKGATDTLLQAWQTLEHRMNDEGNFNPLERLWLLELKLASTPMFLAGEGTRNLVWAMICVGRESVSVKIRYIDPNLLEQRLRETVYTTATDLFRVLQKRKYAVSIEAVKNQPDPASLTVLDLKE